MPPNERSKPYVGLGLAAAAANDPPPDRCAESSSDPFSTCRQGSGISRLEGRSREAARAAAARLAWTRVLYRNRSLVHDLELVRRSWRGRPFPIVFERSSGQPLVAMRAASMPRFDQNAFTAPRGRKTASCSISREPWSRCVRRYRRNVGYYSASRSRRRAAQRGRADRRWPLRTCARDHAVEILELSAVVGQPLVSRSR